MKRLLKALIHFLEGVTLFTIIPLFGSIPVGIALFLLGVIPLSKVTEDISGNMVKNSIFSVSNKGMINQNALAHPKELISSLGKKDKNKYFIEETLNMFLQLDRFSSKGEEMTYSTVSHSITLQLLKNLEKNGYIKDLKYKKVKTSRLFFEKLLIGNLKGFGKKHPMYSISFNLTEKNRDKDEIIALMNPNQKIEIPQVGTVQTNDLSNKNTIKPTENIQESNSKINNEIEQTVTKEDLIRLREELIRMKEIEKNEYVEDEQKVI